MRDPCATINEISRLGGYNTQPRITGVAIDVPDFSCVLLASHVLRISTPSAAIAHSLDRSLKTTLADRFGQARQR